MITPEHQQLKDKYLKLHTELAGTFHTTPKVIGYIRSRINEFGGRPQLLHYVGIEADKRKKQLELLVHNIEENKTPEKQTARLEHRVGVVRAIGELLDVAGFLTSHSDFEISEMCGLGI